MLHILKEYLARLKQIRLQNFNERRMQQAKMAGKADEKYRVRLIINSKTIYCFKIVEVTSPYPS